MGKLKNLLEEQKNELKDIFVKYLVTIISVFVLCILVIIWDEVSVDFDDIFEQFITFMGIFICGTFFIETVIKKNKVVMYFIDAFVSFVWTILGYNLYDWLGESASEFFTKFFALYIMLILGISFYRIIRRSGLSFQKYVTKVIINFVKWGLIFLVIDIGIAVILGIFDSLIFDIDYFDVFFNLQLLMAGLIYFPYALICIMAEEEEKTKFFKVVAKFIAMPILLIAMAIIYIYILKIIFTQNVPKNEVFYICAGVFSLGLVVNTMAYAYIDGVDSSVSDENTLSVYDKIIKYLKYGFIPMVLLEMYSMGTRIAQYGVTDSRYMAVVFIIAQIIYLAWEPINKLISRLGRNKKSVGDIGYLPDEEIAEGQVADTYVQDVAGENKRKFVEGLGYGKGYEKLIFVAIIIYVIVAMLPVVNIDFVCYNSQKHRMEKALDRNDYATALSSYSELKFNIYGKKYIDKNYSKEDIEKLYADYHNDNDYNSSYNYYGTYISPSYSSSDIDIAGYSRMYTFSYDNYDEIDMKKAHLEIYPLTAVDNEDVSIKIDDISDIIEDALTDDGYYSDDRYNNSTISAREYIYGDKKLVITDIRFRYYEDGSTIEDLYLRGYVLIK